MLDLPTVLKIFFLVFGCLGCAQPDTSLVNPPAQAGRSFLALGDSYTIGEGVGEADRWPVQLARQLRQQGIDLNDPDLIARTGWTTAELQDAISASGNQNGYELVTLLIGVNNQYRGQSIDRYRVEFCQLLQTAIRYARNRPGRVVVLSIPDWGQSPYAAGSNRTSIGRQIDAFNAIARAESQQAGVAYVDITPLTRAAAADAAQFVPDGLHYSGRQMEQWAGQMLPIVAQLLR